MLSHRVYAKRVRAHAGKARRTSDDEPVRSRGLKGVRVTSRPSPGLFEPLLFIGSPRSIPLPAPPPAESLPFLARTFHDGFRPFPPFRVAKSRKSLVEKTPQPLTGDACTGREEKKRVNPEKDDQDDCQRQTGKRRRRRGIQREDNAVSNVRGITMRRRKPADWLLLRSAPVKSTARTNVFVRSVTRFAGALSRKRGSRFDYNLGWRASHIKNHVIFYRKIQTNVIRKIKHVFLILFKI